MAVSIDGQVQSKIDVVNAVIAEALASTDIAFNALQEIANLNPGYVQFNPEPFTPDAITIDAVRPTSPDMDAQLEALAPSNIEDIQISDIQLDVQPLPDYIQNWIPRPVDYVEGVYSSTLLDELSAQLLSDLQNGSTGLTSAVEQDMWDRDAERVAQEWRDARDKVLATWATSGFVLPDNVLTASIQELISKQANANTDRSRDIRIESFKRADENRKFVIQQGIVLESQLMQHFNQTADRALKFVLGSAEVAAAIYRSLIEAYKAENEVALMDMKVRSEIEQIKIAQLQAKLLKYKTDADVAVTKIKALIDKYQVDISAYSAELSKAEALARVTLGQQAQASQQYIAAFQGGLEAAKSNMSAFTALTSVKTSAATSMGNIYASYISMAVNSLTAVLNMTQGYTESRQLAP